ncbi:hypothetical protein CsSME_00010488 [Camellia sinensis var. sinensis]
MVKTISLGLSSEGGVEGYALSFRSMNPRRTLLGEVEVLLELCHTKLIKAHKHHLGGGNTQLCFLNTQSFCLFVKLTDLGIGEVSGTHPLASSRLCFQVIKRHRTEEHGLDQ